MKFHVILTKGNAEQNIKAFNDKDEAISFGKNYFDKMNPGDGVITVEGIEVGNPQRKVITGWHF